MKLRASMAQSRLCVLAIFSVKKTLRNLNLSTM